MTTDTATASPHNDDLGPWYYGCANELKPTDDRLAKYRKQRDKHGFDDTECWNLDRSIAAYILPRLKRFMKIDSGTPHGMTEDKWRSIQSEIIDGLKVKVGDDWYIKGDPDGKWARAKELLFEHIDGLWD